MPRLDNKIAVITGGCSGIGLATVELFVAEGARVIVADIQDSRGESLARRLGEAVRYQHCDVTDEAQIAATMQAAVDAFGGLDIVFNNAGAGGTRATIEEMTGEDWDRTQALLLRSVALGMRHAVPHMKARGGGAIVNTSSVSALEAGAAPICLLGGESGGAASEQVGGGRVVALRHTGERDLPRVHADRDFYQCVWHVGQCRGAGQCRAKRHFAICAAAGHTRRAEPRGAGLPVSGVRRGRICDRHASCGGWRADDRAAQFLGSERAIGDF